jgi:hypothetical protein
MFFFFDDQPGCSLPFSHDTGWSRSKGKDRVWFNNKSILREGKTGKEGGARPPIISQREKVGTPLASLWH